MHKWYVVQVLSTHEKKTKKALEEHLEIKGMSDQFEQILLNTNGVIDFLGGEKPVPLSDREVNEILKDLEEKKQKITQKHKIEIGDNVKIIDGVFVNFLGTVIEVFHDKGRLSVMVSIFGRDTRVDDLEFTQVEEVSEEAKNT